MKQTNIDEWLKSGEYLPEVLRDFHDQKDVFKAMHEIIKEPEDGQDRRPTWREGHIYVIDVFLWFMARRGYTLQRTRRRGNFRDLSADVQRQNELRDAASTKILLDAMTDDKHSTADKIVGPSDELKPGWLRKQLQQANEGVLELKKHSPHIFPEWQELQQSKTALRIAEERYDSACKRWHRLGSKD